MDSLEIAPPPAEYQLPQDESALVDPTQQSSAAIVDPEEKGKQNKFVDFFRNIFGKDDYFSSLQAEFGENPISYKIKKYFDE